MVCEVVARAVVEWQKGGGVGMSPVSGHRVGLAWALVGLCWPCASMRRRFFGQLHLCPCGGNDCDCWRGGDDCDNFMCMRCMQCVRVSDSSAWLATCTVPRWLLCAWAQLPSECLYNLCAWREQHECPAVCVRASPASCVQHVLPSFGLLLWLGCREAMRVRLHHTAPLLSGRSECKSWLCAVCVAPSV